MKKSRFTDSQIMAFLKQAEPRSKPLYFILESEKASSERSLVRMHGFKFFSRSSKYLFPMLSALEVLQRDEGNRPLWKIFMLAQAYPDRANLLGSLNQYLKSFSEDRKLGPFTPPDTVEQAFETLVDLAIKQFEDVSTTRRDINENYMQEVEERICNEFIKSRGRSGRVFMLNPDQLVLLTNLVIGQEEKLRLHELMMGFERRGFYLDNQSRQVLVAFYERIGNVERMSDSGDAVYVRKTI